MLFKHNTRPTEIVFTCDRFKNPQYYPFVWQPLLQKVGLYLPTRIYWPMSRLNLLKVSYANIMGLQAFFLQSLWVA
jgi:hypothetical protein